MGIAGFAGRVLYIDLTSGKSRAEPLDPELLKSLIGGYGINNKLAYDLMPPGVAPLSPENLIIIGAGPFAGTLVPGAARILATTKFPINGAFSTAAGGGAFALMLKSAGYDHVVISGRAPRPVYLTLGEEGVEVCDASDLWGRDSFETIDILRKRYEPCSVIPIGQAGENLVKLSIGCVDKAGTLGRGGLPAIMGSKNLKAIVVRQGEKAVNVADRAALTRLVNELHERIMKWEGRKPLLDNGLTPLPPGIAGLHSKTRRALACPSCPLADKQMVTLDSGRYGGLQTYMPHLTLYQFGAQSNADKYEQAVRYLDALNRYGLCHVDFSSLLSSMINLYREGIITREDTGGIELKGDIETALRLARLTAYREGFGDVLAEGLVGAARRIGRAAEKYIAHIKGLGILYDPRLRTLGTMEFGQITNPRGAHLAAAGSPSRTPGRPPSDFARHADRMGALPEALGRVASPTDFNPARYCRYSEDWYSLFNCLSLCNRAQINRFYHVKTIAALYSAVTGIDFIEARLMQAAERAWTLGKLLNVREGFDRRDDRAPDAWFRPLLKDNAEHHLTDYYGNRSLVPEDIERLLDDYYDERGYDRQSGLPTLQKLRELGLENLAADLNKPGEKKPG